MKLYWGVPIVIAVFVLIIALTTNNKAEACFEKTCVKIEIADNFAERERGLMFRDQLDEHAGMLFVFDKTDKHGFWMKNTLIPLDIIWINEDMRVVDFTTMTPCIDESCKIYFSTENAKYALEVNSRFVRENGIEIGDEVFLRDID